MQQSMINNPASKISPGSTNVTTLSVPDAANKAIDSINTSNDDRKQLYDQAKQDQDYDKYLKEQKAGNYLKLELNYKKATSALDAQLDSGDIDITTYENQLKELSSQKIDLLGKYANKEAAAKQTYNIEKYINAKVGEKIQDQTTSKLIDIINGKGVDPFNQSDKWENAQKYVQDKIKADPKHKAYYLTALSNLSKITDADEEHTSKIDREQKLITNELLKKQDHNFMKQFNEEKLNILSSTFEDGKFKNMYKDSAKYKQDEQKYIKSLIKSGVSQSDALTYWNNITKIKEPKQLSVTQQALLDAKKDKDIVDKIDVSGATKTKAKLKNQSLSFVGNTRTITKDEKYNLIAIAQRYIDARSRGYNSPRLHKYLENNFNSIVNKLDREDISYLIDKNIITGNNNINKNNIPIFRIVDSRRLLKYLKTEKGKIDYKNEYIPGKWTFSHDGKQAQWDSKFSNISNLSDNAKYGLHMKILSKNKNNILPSLENLKKDNPGYYGYLSKNEKAMNDYSKRRIVSLITKGMKGVINTSTNRNIKITSDYHGNVMFALPGDNNSFYEIMDKLPKGAALVTSNLGQETINTYRERLKTIKKDNKKLGKLKYILKNKFNISHATGNWKINPEKFAEVIDYIAHDDRIDKLIKQ